MCVCVMSLYVLKGNELSTTREADGVTGTAKMYECVYVFLCDERIMIHCMA
jgi:hypothetical protein